MKKYSVIVSLTYQIEIEAVDDLHAEKIAHGQDFLANNQKDLQGQYYDYEIVDIDQIEE